MTHHLSVMVRHGLPRLVAVVTGAIALATSVSALAQTVAEPWRSPSEQAAPDRTRVTSSEDASKASPNEQRLARDLAVAVFDKPAAAKRAADKATKANPIAITPADPKPEWLAKDGVQIGGGGMKVTTPF